MLPRSPHPPVPDPRREDPGDGAADRATHDVADHFVAGPAKVEVRDSAKRTDHQIDG